MRSHSVTCHPAEATLPHLPQPIKADTRFSDPGGMHGWADIVGLVTYRDGIPAQRRYVYVACGRGSSSSDGVAIRYILPVLWMTSCLHTTGPVVRIKHDVMFEEVRQVAAPVKRKTTTAFGRVRQNVAPGQSLLSMIDLLHTCHMTNL